MNRHEMTVSEVAEILNLEYHGKDISIDGLNLCNRESLHKRVLSYISEEKYVDNVRQNDCVVAILLTRQMYELCTEIINDKQLTYILSENPEKDFYKLHQFLFTNTNFYDEFNFKKKIGENCTLAENCVIEDGVILGNNVKVGCNSVVKKGTVIGDNVSIGNNSVIGSEGFQVIKFDGQNVKINHVGGCYIAENVSVADNVTVGNSLFENTTRIGRNSMIDNHCHIGHNVVIGENVTITASTVLCGSSIVEDGAWIGVNSTILNRIVVGKNSLVGAASVVTKNVGQNKKVYGCPARER